MTQITQNPRTPAQNRKLYWLFGQLGIDAETIADMVWDETNHRTQHSGELSFMEAMNLIRRLENLYKGQRFSKAEQIERGTDEAQRDDLDRKRKGVIKAIFRYLELKQCAANMDYVKGIACRAAGVESFNRISPEMLTRLYNEFCRKQQVLMQQNGMINQLKNMN